MNLDLSPLPTGSLFTASRKFYHRPLTVQVFLTYLPPLAGNRMINLSTRLVGGFRRHLYGCARGKNSVDRVPAICGRRDPGRAVNGQFEIQGLTLIEYVKLAPGKWEAVTRGIFTSVEECKAAVV
jgi:hypothetical protein